MAEDIPTEPLRLARTYTLSEAVEYMRFMNQMTASKTIISWVNAKTGKPVSIGASDLIN